jgi:hypothetical protein
MSSVTTNVTPSVTTSVTAADQVSCTKKRVEYGKNRLVRIDSSPAPFWLG